MIKFFRRIRFDLMEKNKTGTSADRASHEALAEAQASAKAGKYFKYAIGEIILVVIGILIALGINNWNESRKNQNLERIYIQELKTDLIKDSTLISTMLNQSNKQLRAKYLLHKYLVENTDFDFFNNNFNHFPDFVKTNNYNVDSLSSYFQIQWNSESQYAFTPITTTIDEMKSIGKIGVIKNQELRRSIIETYNSYESYKLNYENKYQKSIEEIYKLVFDEIPALYTMDNSNLIEIFKDQRVRNRFEGNFVIGQNGSLRQLKQVNQKLLDELNLYSKR